MNAAPQRRSREEAAIVKSWNPIESVLAADGVRLQRRGDGRLQALCPLHRDTTPSFWVNVAAQTFHCFGACATGGDVIDYVRLRDRLGGGKEGFKAALAVLAGGRSTDGVAPPPPPKPYVPPRITAGEREAIRVAGDWYRAGMEHAPAEAFSYLAARGIPARSAGALALGYGRPGLAAALERAGVPEEAAAEVGLLARSRDGQARLYEPMRDRVVVTDAPPGEDAHWLTGRMLPNAARRAAARAAARGSHPPPPYRNVRKAPKPLLGVRWMTDDAPFAVLVEGPFDWIAARMSGLPAIAATGQLSRAAVERLSRFGTVAVATDADDAGDAIADRIREQAPDVRVFRVTLPDGVSDPGELNERGANGRVSLRVAVRAALAAAEAGPARSPRIAEGEER